MSERIGQGRAGIIGAAEKLIHGWALFGGLVLFGIVAINVLSVIGGMFGRPFPGDFELTQIGVAVAAFAFLPYCQLIDANVTADIFTARASRRLIAVLKTVAAIVAIGFSAILLWRMFAGMLDQREYGYTTAILQFPIWLGFIPILISLALLFVAALITFGDGCRQSVGRSVL